MDALLACMSMYNEFASQKNSLDPLKQVTNHCELPYGSWDLNSGHCNLCLAKSMGVGAQQWSNLGTKECLVPAESNTIYPSQVCLMCS